MTNKIENTSLSNRLPSFRKPPINEVVCGLRFRPADRLKIPHIGLLWNKFQADYPLIQHAPPIASAKGEILVDNTTKLPLPRVWFINPSDDQLIQFQLDRFYFNWRKKEHEYPRYKHVISNFENLLTAVKDLFKDCELGDLEPMEYELSYINHIPKEIGWTTIDDLDEIFSDFLWNKAKAHFLPNPENVNWSTRFSFNEKKSHLAVSLKEAIRKEDEVPVLIFELKANGFDKHNKMRNWFDLAHQWIVQGFTDLTTKKMHKIWEIEENA